METTKQNLRHFKGAQAYLIRCLDYYCRIRISSITALECNLEVIVNNAGDVVLYRYDPPDEIKGLLHGEGEWKFK